MVEFDKLESERMIFSSENTLNGSATRSTDTFALDYRLPVEFYNPTDFIVTYTFNGGTPVEITNTSDYVYYDFENRLYLTMTKEAMPGTYIIDVKYVRGTYTLNAGRLTVEKLPGTSGYLNNIKFSRFIMGTEYPVIRVVNADNTMIDETYLPNIYYLGIDYDNADRNMESYFRIDGEVARIPLYSYMPVNMVNYLPDGAMIKRIYYVDGVPQYSPLVGINSTQEEIEASLSADFTVDPKTGLPPTDLSTKVYIEYVVVPESELTKPLVEQNVIKYYISVTDKTFTFLGVFNFWYRDSLGNTTRIDDISAFNLDMLFFNVYNVTVSEGGVIKSVTEVPVQLSDFGTLTFDKSESINSRANLFYLVNGLTQDSYIYQMGSNYSGYYQFELKVKEGYSYKIYLQNHTSESNLLPLFSSRVEHLGGYFYYINTSSLMRTRYFHVVIEEGTSGDGTWGLTDYHNTWDKP